MLDRDYAIQLAMEYGFTGGFDAEGNLTFDATFVEAVAEAVAKTRKATLEEMIYEHPTIAIKKAVEYEREACAKVCDELAGVLFCHNDKEGADLAVSLRDSIRSRGQT